MSRRGMSLGERREARQRIIDSALTNVARLGRSMVCAWENHERCRGEEPPNGGGCLCECHDPQAGDA